MKLIRVIAASLAVLVASSVSSFAPQANAQSSILSTVLSGSSSGRTAGAAVKALYQTYKSTGTIDLKNTANIVNITRLTTSIKGLKGQTNKSQFYKDFAKGLVLGSDSLITSALSGNATQSLSKLANGLDFNTLLGTNTKVEDKIAGQKEIVSTVTDLFKMFK